VADVVVREANLADARDAEAVVEMIDMYARDPMGRDERLPHDVRSAIVPGLRAHPASLVFLAFEARNPVGVAVCFRAFSTFHARPIMNLHDLAVRPGWRGRGIGLRLFEAVEARARALGCCKVTLEVRGDNRPAQGLYRRLGFRGEAEGRGRALMLFWEKPLA
jgi:ribosomal protein S18 acetylase RimI-like enzyme